MDGEGTHRWRGSSPLARGLLVGVLTGVVAFRIIPARAGFTAGRRARRRPAGDHPRSRGVYDDACGGPGVSGGSSPLARGLRRQQGRRRRRSRIIPARAGFTVRDRPGGRGWGDHPRSRGVYLMGMGVRVMADGSSPLARGLRAAALSNDPATGIIPARAGFTAASRGR